MPSPLLPACPMCMLPSLACYAWQATLKGIARLLLTAGTAKPSPQIGQALGPLGVNMMEFCKQFNSKTGEYKETALLRVKLKVRGEAWGCTGRRRGGEARAVVGCAGRTSLRQRLRLSHAAAQHCFRRRHGTDCHAP